MKSGVDTGTKNKVITLINKLDADDRPEREKWVPIWRKLEYLWSGWAKITWDPVSRDWRTSYDDLLANQLEDLYPEDLYRNVNIYRAHGEAIIAALSASLPNVRFFPDDADNPEDITTSRACTKINEKIDIESNTPLTFIHALYILFNQSFVAFYNYYERNGAYGKAKVPKYGMEEQDEFYQFCPGCGAESDESNCPDCVDPQSAEPMQTVPDFRTNQVPVIEDYEEIDKGKVCIEAWGPLNVKILHGVKAQKDTPYLFLETEVHESILESIYKDKPEVLAAIRSTGSNDPDRFDRTNVFNPSLHTVQRCWLRPCLYEDDPEAIKEYPDGKYVVIIDRNVEAECLPEKLDDCWTITENPLARYIHADPQGLQVSHVQEMINELVDLTMQTIEQGAEQIFADPRTLDFTQYGNSEVKPGTVYPAKALPNKSLGESFFALKAASLSQEVDRFRFALDGYAQITSGALPTIYGGQIEGGSNTFREYDASKNQALQRLSLTWRMLNLAWAEVKRKSVKEYKENLIEDEKFVKKFGNSFISVHIKRAELEGKIGRVAAEVSDQLPTSWVQKRGTWMELLQTANPQLLATLFHPENTTLGKDLLGLSDLYIPGEDDRVRQLFDIQELLAQQPEQIPAIDPMTGMPMMDPMTGMEVPPQIKSSIPPNPDLDDNEVRIQVLRAWLLSEVGEDNKITNPPGYENVMAQLRERVQLQQEQMMQQMGPLPNGMPPGDDPNAEIQSEIQTQ